jgi:hypothetical protein
MVGWCKIKRRQKRSKRGFLRRQRKEEEMWMGSIQHIASWADKGLDWQSGRSGKEWTSEEVACYDPAFGFGLRLGGVMQCAKACSGAAAAGLGVVEKGDN